MQFLLIIYQSEMEWTKLKDAQREVIYQGYRKLIQQLASKCNFLGGHELKLTPTAKTMRTRDNK